MLVHATGDRPSTVGPSKLAICKLAPSFFRQQCFQISNRRRKLWYCVKSCMLFEIEINSEGDCMKIFIHSSLCGRKRFQTVAATVSAGRLIACSASSNCCNLSTNVSLPLYELGAFLSPFQADTFHHHLWCEWL